MAELLFVPRMLILGARPLLPCSQLYFWTGDDASQDLYSTAAIRAAELDYFLGHRCIQHREIMGKESKSFQSLFLALTVLRGDSSQFFEASNAKKYRPRLLQVRIEETASSSRTAVVREVELAPTSINESDAFIYDGGLRILVWYGRLLNHIDKIKVCHRSWRGVLAQIMVAMLPTPSPPHHHHHTGRRCAEQPPQQPRCALTMGDD
jgi:hypothetical protein